MNERKENIQYVFTVEGETEKRYLYWLCNEINANQLSKYRIALIIKVQQHPAKYAKTINPISTPKVTHLCDVESNKSGDIKKFENIINELNEAKRQRGRYLTYDLGYSNLTFELWLILHKCECNTHFSDKLKYLDEINKAFNEHFENLDQYKQEDNFNRCLSKLTLTDVKNAIKRAKHIMYNNEINNIKQTTCKGYKYYNENPSLTIWEKISEMLNECGLL